MTNLQALFQYLITLKYGNIKKKKKINEKCINFKCLTTVSKNSKWFENSITSITIANKSVR